MKHSHTPLVMFYIIRLYFQIKSVINKIFSNALKEYYTYCARKRAVTCGKDLRVNNRSVFIGEYSFGDNCNFNGMQVLGGAKYLLATISILA